MVFSRLQIIAELCARKGIEDVVICPGSRSAPLTLAFLRNGKFRCRIIADERSAGFIALGLTQSTSKPVIVICTSGTAAYNLAPAVAEAFFQHLPLLVFTADRPAEWLDQLDGQTIRQARLYGDHVKHFYEWPKADDHPDTEWHANRMINEAVNLSEEIPAGPVHVNFPFREPLYPKDDSFVPTDKIRVIESVSARPQLSEAQWRELESTLRKCKRVLIVAGQQDADDDLIQILNGVHQNNPRWVFAGDILSNHHGLPSFCSHSDTFIGQLGDEEKRRLQPDLLITYGKSLVAKNLKIFLRKYAPGMHWHIQSGGQVADTFQHLSHHIQMHPRDFFQHLQGLNLADIPEDYAQLWNGYERKTVGLIHQFFQSRAGGEFAAVKKLLSALPQPCHLHLANSMAVRYANHIGLSTESRGVKVYSNRGTSGIDGCTSTAVGHALGSRLPQVLITGDMAFFYDRNAFWNEYPTPNLFIMLLNNHGGIIFNLIDGPSSIPESEKYFVTRQSLNAKALAAEFGLHYHDLNSVQWSDFFVQAGKARVLEVEGAQQENKEIFEAFRKHLKKGYAT
ncbi:MAG: 2-succinyl-5-enolpyruvyl-6-hydroxy-3-cyclohexene-1-carboxylic-acid synthase [Bacteroidetes bacterium]|nr:2-succinyl-5-enolpyruvyl-6-hydroxy-3-cyclohexene-1-carboxylic-acid synthase [Bacteroidota bacterium]